MLFSLNPFTKPSLSASSSSSTYASTLPHASSYLVPDRYPFPFPTSPGQVKKARHDDHPKYLPPPNASVRDVQFFLYTLLTSKQHNCAKKYPEWVLETCMAWSGDGEAFRDCSEEQLATLCPYTAVAIGIDSRKHTPGTFVPIPARNMIGEVIVRFVAEKRARKNLPSEIQQRLQAERSRSFSGMRSRPIPQVAQNLGAFSTVSPASPRLSRHSSLRSPSVTDGTNLSVPTPAMWMTPTMTTIRHIPTPELSPTNAPLYGGSFQSVRNQPIHSRHIASGVPPPWMSDVQRGAPTYQIPQHQRSDHKRGQLRTSSASIDTTRPSTTGRPLSQRYAPRRQLDLHLSGTAGKNVLDKPSSTIPQPPKSAINMAHKDSGSLPPTRPHGGRRRRSSLASSSKFSIPEKITEELEHSDPFERHFNGRQALRHDSGADDSSCTEQARSHSLPSFVTTDSSTPSSPQQQNTTIINFSHSPCNDAIDSFPNQVHSSPQLGHALPVAREMARAAPLNLQGIKSTSSVLADLTFPPVLDCTDVPNKPRASIMDRKREDYAVSEPEFDRLQSLEADNHSFKQVRGAQQSSASIRTGSLRSMRSDRTRYSSLTSVPGLDGMKPHVSQNARSSLEQSQSFEVKTKPLTLMDMIEKKERRARRLSSSCQQWISRQKSMTRLGIDLKRQ